MSLIDEWGVERDRERVAERYDNSKVGESNITISIPLSSCLNIYMHSISIML
jgi:hypothetical protein